VFSLRWLLRQSLLNLSDRPCFAATGKA
jgi:hypothetical protein